MHLSDLSIRRPIFLCMVLLTLGLFGFISFQKMGVDLYPKVEIPVITVLSALPGASPEIIEKNVTEPIEEALATLSSLKNLRSKSMEGISQVVLEFALEKDIDIAYQEVQAKMGGVRHKLPNDLLPSVVEKFDIDSAPILSVLVSAKLPIEELTFLVDQEIKEPLQRIPSVGQVKRIGGQDKRMWVWIDRDLLESRGLSLQEIETAIKHHHIEFPGGRLQEGKKEISVRTKAEFASKEALQDLIVAYRNHSPVYLREVSRVEEGIEERRSSSQLNGTSAIALEIRRQSGTNTVEVAEAVKASVQKMQKTLGKKGINLQIAQDNSLYIRRSIDHVLFDLYFGGACAILIVALFLRNLSSTVACALSLPTAVIGSFAFLHLLGFTQNLMTLLGLSLAIGLLIDDAIVIQENITRHREMGKDKKEAAAFGAKEIALAVLATTFSIVAVFVPVAFMQGIIGRFFYQFGLTITASVLISLFVSLTLNPLFSSRFLTLPKKGKFYCAFENFFQGLERKYAQILHGSLRYRFWIVVLALSLFVLTIFSVKFLRFEFSPKGDQSEFMVELEMPQGSSLELTEEGIENIRAKLQKESWVEYLFSSIGGGEFQEVSKGKIYVKMLEKEERVISQEEAMEKTRKKLSSLPLGSVTIAPVVRMSGGGLRSAEIQFNLRGPSLETLIAKSEKILEKMKNTKGYLDAKSSYEEAKPEIEVLIQREIAADLGITPAAIASTIRSALGGSEVAKFSKEGKRFDIVVRLEENLRRKMEDILFLKVKNSKGQLIPLHNLVEVKPLQGAVAIDHYQRMKQITLFANLDRNYKVLGEAIPELSRFAGEEGLPMGYSYGFSGSAEMFQESFSHLFFALFLGVVMVYVVLASQLESFLHPLVIMIALPLSLIGAIGALLLFKMTMSVFTMIGIILLMGLVAKNGILLVDRINCLRKEGKEKNFAIVEGSSLRLRPILMTSCAVIVGMLPTAFSRATGSEVKAPMALVLIGGLITSTLLTLVIIPVIYSLVEDLKEKLHSKKYHSPVIKKEKVIIDWKEGEITEEEVSSVTEK